MSNHPIDQGIARRLGAERHRLRMTQVEVAAIGAVSSPTQVAYEQGARSLAMEYLRRLRPAGFDVWHLLFEESFADAAIDAVDWDLIIKLRDAMNEWCTSRGVEIRANKQGEVLRLLYSDYRRKPNGSSIEVDRILKLVA